MFSFASSYHLLQSKTAIRLHHCKRRLCALQTAHAQLVDNSINADTGSSEQTNVASISTLKILTKHIIMKRYANYNNYTLHQIISLYVLHFFPVNPCVSSTHASHIFDDLLMVTASDETTRERLIRIGELTPFDRYKPTKEHSHCVS